MAGILVVSEVKSGQFRKVSFEIASEAVRCAEKLGLTVTGLVAGHGVKALAPALGEYGVEKILVVDDARLDNAYINSYAEAVTTAIARAQADYIFFPASITGKALSAVVAAKVRTSVMADCTELTISDGKLLAQRPVYAGKAMVQVSANQKPVVLSLRPNIFAVQEKPTQATVEELSVEFSAEYLQTRILEVKASAGEKMDLTEAPIIVSGGRGMKGPENFHLIEKLAEALGGVPGASRAVVDEGWRPHEEQVGQTGKTVSPQLYIACGISGAIQHLAGMRTSKVIVAVNKDREAPIFQVADYGIVGNVFEVLPRMIEQAKAMRQ